jgi:hypothetical protein
VGRCTAAVYSGSACVLRLAQPVYTQPCCWCLLVPAAMLLSTLTVCLPDAVPPNGVPPKGSLHSLLTHTHPSLRPP